MRHLHGAFPVFAVSIGCLAFGELLIPNAVWITASLSRCTRLLQVLLGIVYQVKARPRRGRENQLEQSCVSYQMS